MKRRRFWTPAEVAYLRERYPHDRSEDVARAIRRDVRTVYAKAAELGLRKTAAYLASDLSGRLKRGSHPASVAHQFRAGFTPWNKGTNWNAGGRSPETRFRKGQLPHNCDPDFYVLGALRWNTEGYLQIRMRFGPRGWDEMHRILWQDKHGPIPAGYSVVFKDGDQTNVELENLEMVSRGDLMRRNTIHRLPPPLKHTIVVLGQLKRRIREKQDRGPARSPVRDA